MARSRISVLWLLGVTLGLAACATEPTGPPPAAPVALRAGVTPDYPPIIFTQSGTLAGVEVDLGQGLGQRLGRPLQWVTLRWEDQIPALLDGRIDIIMSGMSVTEARRTRIAFSNPYLESGLMAALRKEDAAFFPTFDRIPGSLTVVAAVEGTTGDVFVQRLTGVRRQALSRASDGALALKRRSIDIFVHDAPFIMWTVSENEADLAGLGQLLTRESLAWGLRRGDEALLDQVNAALSAWKQDGTLARIVKKWLPAWRPPQTSSIPSRADGSRGASPAFSASSVSSVSSGMA